MKTTILEKTSLESGGGWLWVLEKILVTLALFWVLSWTPSDWVCSGKTVMDSRWPAVLLAEDIKRIEPRPVDTTWTMGFGPELGVVY